MAITVKERRTLLVTKERNGSDLLNARRVIITQVELAAVIAEMRPGEKWTEGTIRHWEEAPQIPDGVWAILMSGVEEARRRRLGPDEE